MIGGRADSRRQVAVAATVAVLLTVIGACAVEVHPNEQVRAEEAAAEALFADGVVEVDLRDPPSRADLALPEGVSSTVLEPDAGSVQVVVTFSDGTVLRTPADAVLVGAPDGAADPAELVLMRRDLSSSQARAVLDEVVADLGVDAATADSAFAAVQGGSIRRVLETRVSGAELMSVELVGVSGSDVVRVHYVVSWDRA